MTNATLTYKLLLGCFTAATAVALAQENPAAAVQPQAADTASQSASVISYSPKQVRVLGDMEYGERKLATSYSAGPRYRAFVFSGYGGDQVEIMVTGASGPVRLALADSTLNQVATGTSALCVSLPNHGPDVELWYIITDNAPTRLTFQVKKTGHENPGYQEASLR